MNIGLPYPAPSLAHCVLSVVVPVFNEEDVLPEFHRRLHAVLQSLGESFEILYVDDGSRDDTPAILRALHAADARTGFIRFSRNFGKEAGMSAGLRACCGEAVVLVDVDLQDPPELIPQMLAAWRNGADMVNMQRRVRHGETATKRGTARLFYRFFNWLSEVPIPENVGDFRLLGRRVVDALNSLPERTRFLKGMFAWVGFHQVTLEYDRAPRLAGTSKWRYWKLWNFALEGITSFSTVPLRLGIYAGFACSASAFAGALYFMTKTLAFGDPVPGFPTLILTILFLGGIQLMGLGVIGEYLGRIFIESKQRPLFLVDEYQPASLTAALPADSMRST